MPRKKRSVDEVDDALTWTPTMDDVLVDAFLNQHNIGNRVNETFTVKAYDEIVKELQEKLGQQIHKDKVKNRWKTIKDNFSKCYDLFKNGMSGFAWSPITSLWSAEPEVWQRLIEAHPSAAKWKSKPIPNYNKLVVLYGNDRANGEEGGTSSHARMRRHLVEYLLTKTIDDVDNLAAANEVTIEAFDNLETHTVDPINHSEFSFIDAGYKGKKKVKKSKNDTEFRYMKEAFTIVADALKEEKSPNEQRLPIREDEVWKLLVDLEIEEDMVKKAYLFLLERPEKIRALLGCPMNMRKDILMMMMVP